MRGLAAPLTVVATTKEETMERYETVIIGGGQAGLSVGYFLKKQGKSFVILDAAERVGDSWRTRWDSLKLYSPASRDGLPGMRFPARRNAYPTKDEMGDYLETYATHFELPIRSGAAVDQLSKDGGTYVARAGDRTVEADNVVIATGVFRKPYTPEFARELDPGVIQLHSNDYRNLSQLQEGPVLVVGASHSGSDIAWEASSTHEVILSGRDNGQIPAPIESRRGRTVFRGLFVVGTYVLTADTPMGRGMRPHLRHGGAPLLRYRRKDLRRAGVERVLARTVGVQNGRPVLDDGRVFDVRNVVWCTGFRPDYSWIRFPFEIGEDGFPVQYRGVVASSPGLYVTGIPFLHSFASMLIGGAGRDAERVARHIVSGRSREIAALPDSVALARAS
jgi:putative flavoprotein involved in K+ transport